MSRQQGSKVLKECDTVLISYKNACCFIIFVIVLVIKFKPFSHCTGCQEVIRGRTTPVVSRRSPVLRNLYAAGRSGGSK